MPTKKEQKDPPSVFGITKGYVIKYIAEDAHTDDLKRERLIELQEIIEAKIRSIDGKEK